MRFMVMVLATDESEAGVMPTTEEFEAMGAYNEELVKAGIMRAGEGLHPSSAGVRVRFEDGRRTVIDGPFTETKELVAGYWIWEADSLEEAIEWVKRCPNPMPGDSDIEIRQIFDVQDFGPELTPEARTRQQEARRRAAAADPAASAGRTRQVAVLHKTTPQAESGKPDEAMLTAMTGYLEALADAGLLVAAEGLHPSRRGARVHFSGPRRSVTDGPFTESKELIAGFSVLRVRDLDEAIEWVKRMPLPDDIRAEIEIRPIFSAEDFGDALTPELREREDRLRTQVEAQG